MENQEQTRQEQRNRAISPGFGAHVHSLGKASGTGHRGSCCNLKPCSPAYGAAASAAPANS